MVHKLVPDGVYLAKLSNGTFRCEKINGQWYFSDGTGWKEKMEFPEEIREAQDISGALKVEKNCVYENSYPLTDFFPKERGDRAS